MTPHQFIHAPKFLFGTGHGGSGLIRAGQAGLCAPAYRPSKSELFQAYTARAQLLRNEYQSSAGKF